jgi:hypothetical protein
MNELIKNPRVLLPGGAHVDVDVCAGDDFSNLGDMNCVLSYREPYPCVFCEAKLNNLNPYKKYGTPLHNVMECAEDAVSYPFAITCTY